MNKTEILQIAKPILFNSDMVRAILNGRKTVTRRVIKLKYDNTHHEMHTDKYGTRLIEIQDDVEGETFGKNEDGSTWHKLRGYIEPKPPYKKGDYLYVRETWLKTDCFGIQDGYFYRANETPVSSQVREEYGFKWCPSIHMPKKAARIFLSVIGVRAERLQDIDDDGAKAEGANFRDGKNAGWEEKMRRTSVERFKEVWDSTIRKKDLDKYGWAANPWVWVIEFERVEA